MSNKKNTTIRVMSVLFVGLTLSACNESGQDSQKTPATDLTPPTPAPPPNTEPSPADAKTVKRTPLTGFYLNLAQQQFDSTCSSVEQLQQSIQQFVSQPSKESLSKVKSEWLISHNNYASTQLFRNISIKHPTLDQSKTNPVQHSLAIRIDQTPMLPGYIDEVEGYPKSGYIFSPLPIDRETLNKEHQFADTAYVSMGFHTIEFLLWGEGSRTYKDFSTLPTVQPESDEENPELFTIRRSQLLSITTEMLAEDLSTLCKEWNLDTGFYSTTLKSLPTAEQNAVINSATEQLISNLQINTAKVRQATDNNKESIEIEPHSAFSQSDQSDIQAQITILKALIDSSEWLEAAKKQEHTKKLTQLAKTLLL